MAHRPNSFLETIIAFLMPYFLPASRDKNEARSEIIDTLAAYETRTRAEMLQAAHIIAFGMTTLDVLAEAKTAEMSQSMRLRYRSCANSLNRSTLQTEKALDQRLGDQIPAAPPKWRSQSTTCGRPKSWPSSSSTRRTSTASARAPTQPPPRIPQQRIRGTRRGTRNFGPAQ
jgi:hypothetical protein